MPTQTRREFLAVAGALTLSARTRLTRATRVRTVAGTGSPGYVPEGSNGADALSTPITNPYGIVAGPDGGLYFCEVDTGRTRRLDLSTNRLTTIAGNGVKAYAGDGGPALEAAFSAPHEVRFDAGGNLYIVERDSHVVRRVDASTRRVSTVAGTGEAGFSGDGGPASRAQLRQPHSIAFDASGHLLICDIGNARIRAIDMSNDNIRTFAGTGERLSTPDTGPLEGTPLNGPRSLDTDDAGNVYLVLREGNSLYRIDGRERRLQRIGGTGETGFTGDGAPAISATFNGPKGVAFSAVDRSLYVVDTENHAIRRVDLRTGLIQTVLGTGDRGFGSDGDPLRCALARPHGVLLHREVLYITDSENHRILAVETAA